MRPLGRRCQSRMRQRLSSRPKAWGRVSVDQVSRMRIWWANGVSIKQAYLEQRSWGLSPVLVASHQRATSHEPRCSCYAPGQHACLFNSHWSLCRTMRSLIEHRRVVTAR